MQRISRHTFLKGVAACGAAAAATACSSDSATSSTTSSAASELLTENGTYPIVKEGESLELSVFMPLRPKLTTYDAPTNLTTGHLEDLTGMHLTFTSPSESDATQKLNVMMTGGTYPEIIVNSSIANSELLLYGQQGIFMPLNDLIDEYGPNIMKALDANPTIKSAVTMTDGNIYALPQMGKSTHVGAAYRMWLNNTWLENLNLEVPTTTEEFYQVLKAFKEQDANGNGNSNDEVPLSGSLSGYNADPTPFIMNAFIPCSPYSDYFNIDDDGKVYYAKTTDAWKEGLKYMNKLYSEGLIDEMLFSQTSDQLLALGSNPGDIILGACAGGSVSVFSNTSDYERWNNFIALPPLEGPNGVRSCARVCDYGTSGLVITNKCACPEAVIRMWDYIFTREGTNLVNVGLAGDGQIDYAPEGSINFVGEAAEYVRLAADNVQDISWNRCGPDYRWDGWDLQFAAADNANEDIERTLYLSATEDYLPCAPAIESLAPPVTLDTDDSRAFVDVETTMFPYIDQITVEFITGSKDIDAEWDNYLAALEGYGLSSYLEIYQAALDARVV